MALFNLSMVGNCRPLQVDGVNIQEYTNQQAVEVLRHTGQTVHLQLIRRGFRPEEIPPAMTPSVAIPPPYATIPTPTAVIRELEQDGEAEDPADGRAAANASFSLKSKCDFKCRCGRECCCSLTCFPLVLMLRRSSALRFTSSDIYFLKLHCILNDPASNKKSCGSQRLLTAPLGDCRNQKSNLYKLSNVMEGISTQFNLERAGNPEEIPQVNWGLMSSVWRFSCC